MLLNKVLLKEKSLSEKSEALKTPGILLIVLLPILMLATRTDHFGSAISLPDASLAVFFLAGFYLRRLWWSLGGFILLCALAVGIDYWAITFRGVSNYCVTPAYGFLLPTYLVVWWAGRWGSSNIDDKVLLMLATAASLLVAFLISNGGFYLFSGYFTEPNVAEYLSRVARYGPRYLVTPLGYLVVAALFHLLMIRSESKQAAQQR